MLMRFARASTAALLSSLLLIPASRAEGDKALRAGVFDPPRVAPDFTLKGSNGKDLVLGSYRGKVVILFFGFTSCPAVCPTTLSTLASAYNQLGERAKEVQVVYVTVDPERDDVEILREYLGAFHPSFLGATGSPEALEAVRRDYGISATKEPLEDGYTYSHSASTYLIDRKGNLRALMPYGQPAGDYVHDLGILLEP